MALPHFIEDHLKFNCPFVSWYFPLSSLAINNENIKRMSNHVPYFFFSVKDLAFLVLGLTQPLLLKVGISEMLGNFHSRDIKLCRCSNNKFLMGPTQRDTIDSQGS